MLSKQDRKRLESLLEDFKHDLLAPESKGHPSLKSCAIGYYADKIEHALPDLRGEFPREAVELLNELAALGSKERFLDITSKAIELSSRANAFERLWNGETEVTGDMVKSRGKPDSFGTTKHRYAVGSVCGTCGRSGEACGLQPGCCLNPHERAYRGCSGCEHFGPCPDCTEVRYHRNEGGMHLDERDGESEVDKGDGLVPCDDKCEWYGMKDSICGRCTGRYKPDCKPACLRCGRTKASVSETLCPPGSLDEHRFIDERGAERRREANPETGLSKQVTTDSPHYGTDEGRCGRRKLNTIFGAVFDRDTGRWLMRIYSPLESAAFYQERRESDRRESQRRKEKRGDK